MNAPRSRPDSKQIVEVDDTYPAQATIPAATNSYTPGEASVCKIQCPASLRPILKKIGNVINDATGGPYITWELRVNGSAWPRLESMANEMSDPARGDEFMPYETELPTGAIVELVAKNSDTASTHVVVGRLIIWYEDRNAQIS